MTDNPTPDLTRLQSILAAHGGEGRPALLPILLDVQREYGFLSAPVVEAIGQELRVPLAEIHGVIEFYTMLYPHPVGRTIVRVCTSPICAAFGGEDVL
ncbi:MAG TPA: NAD(P)H-dependent oxidoreductase subunit E, partial [Anaerolineales bacterium]|nr:NAD(P)H-dependent oxidoreductase subunit E [Anaerolineales bacterium]